MKIGTLKNHIRLNLFTNRIDKNQIHTPMKTLAPNRLFDKLL